MKKIALATAIILLSATAAFAATKTYQVTGEVLEVDDSKIVISKGKDNWEIDRDKKTKVPAGVKVGSKITVEYVMTALNVTDKTNTKKGKDDKGAPAPSAK